MRHLEPFSSAAQKQLVQRAEFERNTLFPPFLDIPPPARDSRRLLSTMAARSSAYCFPMRKKIALKPQKQFFLDGQLLICDFGLQWSA